MVLQGNIVCDNICFNDDILIIIVFKKNYRNFEIVRIGMRNG